MEEFGADPLRWYMISNSSPWDNLKFDKAGVKESARKFFATLYNTYGFFALYANVDGFDASYPVIPLDEHPEIDQWVISVLNTLVQEVTNDLDDYEPTRAARLIGEFVTDNLSNWYVRLNRKRFWGGKMDKDKLAAYQTLYQCLETVSRLIAPISPFYADKLYRDLHKGMGEEVESVHLALFPEAVESAMNPDLEVRMKLAQTITSMVLALRRKVNIKVRQPLSTLMIPVADNENRRQLEAIKELVLNEVNVKDMKLVSDDEGTLVKKLKLDFKKLGPKFGKQMKAVAAVASALTTKEIDQLQKQGYFDLNIEGGNARLELADVEVLSEDIPGWLVANEGSVTVALDVTVTPALRAEGLARELVNRIQNIRKGRDYEITDRINVVVDNSSDEYVNAVDAFNDYIAGQVLAANLTTDSVGETESDVELLDIDGDQVRVKISKV